MLKENILFEIKDLVCSYNPENRSAKDILKIKKLTINRGKLVFIIGKSGSGKSTFLETLGLMSNTIKSGTVNFFPENDISVPVSNLWNEKQWKKIEEFRKANFSFIFQKAKFPDGYTVISSVSFPQLIQGIGSKDSQNLIYEYLDSIGLSINDITMPFELSGGMAQQASFIRALARDFTVLFGDEPTGNIDNTLSFQLMNLLKRSLTMRNGTAIIVTHYIPLAIEFADQIIIIQKDRDDFGYISNDAVFNKFFISNGNYTWNDHTGKKYTKEEIISSIDLSIISSRKKFEIKKIPKIKARISNDKNLKQLEKIFIQKENSKLCGQKNRTKFWGWRSWLIFSILLLTFLTIGFAVGSTKYLKEKVNDPYINYVDISVPWERSDDITIDSIFNVLETDSIVNTYHIQNVTGHKVFSLHFQNVGGKQAYEEYVGRTVSPDNSLLNKILGKENLIIGKNQFDHFDVGLVVTRDLLEYLEYIDSTTPNSDIKVPFIKMMVKEDLENHTYRYIPIPVKAVVKELPGLSKFISTPYFYVQRYGAKVIDNPFTSYDTKRLHIWTEKMETEKFDSLSMILNNYFKLHYKIYDPMLSFEKHNQSYIEGNKIVISFYPDIKDITIWDSVFRDIHQNTKSRNFQIYRYYHLPNLTSDKDLDKYDQLSIYFQKLDKVRDFEIFFNNEFNLEIDIAKINEKENYNFVSKLTFFLGMLMVLISAVGICVFISTIVFNHLREESENIGIHKAFGMTYPFLMTAYMKITLMFLGLPLIVSLFLSYIGGICFIRAISRWTHILEQNKPYFDIFNMWTGFALFFIVISVVISVFFTMRRILKSTPSDLIYSRN